MLKQIRLNVMPCLAAFCCTMILVASVSGQEKEKQESAEKTTPTAEEKDDSEERLFVVPEGTPAELFRFMSKVKRSRPEERTREASVNHLKLQVEAVLAACDKILEAEPEESTELRVINEKLGAYSALKRVDRAAGEQGLAELMKTLEADTRPVIVKLVATKKFELKAATVPSMSASERDDFINELFAMIDENGLNGSSYSMASGVGQLLGRAKDKDAAVDFYTRLANAMDECDDERLKSRAERTRGSARRMKLPGNFMEITGTTAEGETFDWSAYRGKVVLVDFWASWCGPCRAEIPNMKTQLENYGPKGFDILGINLDTSMEKYQQYVDQQELTWTNLLSDKDGERGWDNPLAAYYGVSGIPTAILVDKEGKVVSMSARGKTLNRLLEELLGPIESSETSEDKKDSADET